MIYIFKRFMRLLQRRAEIRPQPEPPRSKPIIKENRASPIVRSSTTTQTNDDNFVPAAFEMGVHFPTPAPQPEFKSGGSGDFGGGGASSEWETPEPSPSPDPPVPSPSPDSAP